MYNDAFYIIYLLNILSTLTINLLNFRMNSMKLLLLLVFIARGPPYIESVKMVTEQSIKDEETYPVYEYEMANSSKIERSHQLYLENRILDEVVANCTKMWFDKHPLIVDVNNVITTIINGMCYKINVIKSMMTEIDEQIKPLTEINVRDSSVNFKEHQNISKSSIVQPFTTSQPVITVKPNTTIFTTIKATTTIKPTIKVESVIITKPTTLVNPATTIKSTTTLDPFTITKPITTIKPVIITKPNTTIESFTTIKPTITVEPIIAIKPTTTIEPFITVKSATTIGSVASVDLVTAVEPVLRSVTSVTTEKSQTTPVKSYIVLPNDCLPIVQGNSNANCPELGPIIPPSHQIYLSQENVNYHKPIYQSWLKGSFPQPKIGYQTQLPNMPFPMKQNSNSSGNFSGTNDKMAELKYQPASMNSANKKQEQFDYVYDRPKPVYPLNSTWLHISQITRREASSKLMLPNSSFANSATTMQPISAVKSSLLSTEHRDITNDTPEKFDLYPFEEHTSVSNNNETIRWPNPIPFERSQASGLLENMTIDYDYDETPFPALKIPSIFKSNNGSLV